MHRPIVLVECMPPGVVAACRELLGGGHDVGEQHGCEHSVDVETGPTSADEARDLVEERSGVAQHELMFRPVEFDIAGVWDVFRQKTAVPHPYPPVFAS